LPRALRLIVKDLKPGKQHAGIRDNHTRLYSLRLREVIRGRNHHAAMVGRRQYESGRQQGRPAAGGIIRQQVTEPERKKTLAHATPLDGEGFPAPRAFAVAGKGTGLPAIPIASFPDGRYGPSTALHSTGGGPVPASPGRVRSEDV